MRRVQKCDRRAAARGGADGLRRIVAVAAALLAVAACREGDPAASPRVAGTQAETQPATGASRPAAKQDEGAPMTGPQLAERVSRRDWNIIERNESVPPAAVPDIAPLLKSDNVEVRELATHVLNAAGGPAAREALFEALQDRNEVVRGNAARFLHNHCTAEQTPQLIGQLRKHSDEYVREQVALLLGKLGDKAAVKPLQEQYAAESFPEAKHAMSLALVRLADVDHTRMYLARLEQDDPKQRVAAVEDFLYIRDRKLVPYFVPLLNDKRDGKNVGPSHGPYWVRVCDVVIFVMDDVLARPFNFPVDRVKKYEPGELNAAAEIMRKVK
jgi:HEAT repeat protein